MSSLRLPQPALAFSVLLIMFVLSTALMIGVAKYDLLPQLWVSLVVAFLAYWAAYFTSERLRLDLFDKRFEIYEKAIEFSSVVMKHGSLRSTAASSDDVGRAIREAYESFRGIGYHKARALFGVDIADLFKEINDSFTYVIAFQDAAVSEVSYAPDRYHERVLNIVSIAERLPDDLRPCLYFGDYRAQ